MKKLLLPALLVAMAYSSSAQAFFQGLKASPDSLRKHVYDLASDSLKGRKTGSIGQRVAATYIADKFREAGLSPINPGSAEPFFQSFELYSSPFDFRNASVKIKDSSRKIYFFSDIMPLSGDSIGNTSIIPYFGSVENRESDSACYAPVVAAKSIDEGLNRIIQTCNARQEEVKGTFLLVLPTNEVTELNRSRFAFASPLMQKTSRSGDTLFYTSTSNPILPNQNSYYSKVLPFLARHPKVDILLTDEILLKKLFAKEALKEYPHVKGTLVGKALEISGSLPADRLTKVQTENVVGVFGGANKKDEAVVVCAHYDHIGTAISHTKFADNMADSIFNGADDNASGTAAVLEIARLLQLAKSTGHVPNRSIILVAFTGEEIGLYGSYYMINNPIIPLKKTAAVVNIDMIGRSNQSHFDSDMYVYPIILGNFDSSPEQHLKQSAQMAKIGISDPISERELDLWTHGSDHDMFVKAGIPSIVITTGEHADYHTPADEASIINYPRMERITNFIFYSLWKLANQ